MACLLALSGNCEGQSFDLGSALTIGIDRSCQIHLRDQAVSWRHARVWLEGDFIWVEDLGSAQGTRVNDSLIQKARLQPGDVLCIGQSRFRLTSEASASASGSAAPKGTAFRPAGEEIKILREQVAHLDGERQNLLRQLEEEKARAEARLENERARLVKDLEPMKKHHEALKKEHGALIKESEALKKENESFKKDSASSARELKTGRDERKKLAEIVSQFERELADKGNEIKRLLALVSEQESAHRQALQAAQQTSQQAAQQAVQQAVQQTAQEATQKAAQQVAALNEQLKAMERKNRQLEIDLGGLEKVRLEDQRAQATLRQDLAQLEEKRRAGLSELERLQEEKIRHSLDQLGELHRRWSEVEAARSATAQERDAARASLAAIDQRQRAAQEEIDSLRQELAAARLEQDRQLAERQTMQESERRAAREKSTELALQLEELEETQASLQQGRDAARARGAVLGEQLALAQQEIQALKKEIESSRQRDQQSLEGWRQAEEKLIQETQARAEEFSRRLAAAEASQQSNRLDRDQLQTELSRLQAEAARSREENQSFRQGREEAARQIRELAEALHAAELARNRHEAERDAAGINLAALEGRYRLAEAERLEALEQLRLRREKEVQLQAEMDKLLGEIESMRRQALDQEDAIRKSAAQSLETMWAASEHRLEEARRKAEEDLKAHRLAHDQECEALRKVQDTLQQEHARALDRERERLHQELAAAEGIFSGRESRFAALLESESQRGRTERQQLVEERDRLEGKIGLLQQEWMAARQDLESRLAGQQAAAAALDRELEKKGEELNRENLQHQERLKEIQAIFDRRYEELSEHLERERAQRESESEQMAGRLESLEKIHRQALADLEKVQSLVLEGKENAGQQAAVLAEKDQAHAAARQSWRVELESRLQAIEEEHRAELAMVENRYEEELRRLREYIEEQRSRLKVQEEEIQTSRETFLSRVTESAAQLFRGLHAQTAGSSPNPNPSPSNRQTHGMSQGRPLTTARSESPSGNGGAA